MDFIEHLDEKRKIHNLCISEKQIEKGFLLKEIVFNGVHGFPGQPATLNTFEAYGINEVINGGLGYSVPLLQKSSFQSLESLWGGRRPAISLPRMSQTCSNGVLVRRTCWPFHTDDSFLFKEIIHKVSTVWSVIVGH